jgi:hypothetical protein
VAYLSNTLSKAGKNHCVTRRELLAIVKTAEHFHKSLCGQEFHLCTDHSALTWLLSFRNLEGQTVHWVKRLEEYNFTSEHRRGAITPTRMHSQADHVQRKSVFARKSNNGQGA